MAWRPFGWEIDWGNAPAWVGAVLSTVSILLVLFVIFRDRRRAIREQASQIFAAVQWQQPAPEGDPAGGMATVTVYNPSNAPIRQVLLEYSPYPKTWPTRVFEEFGRKFNIEDFMTPGINFITASNYTSTIRIIPPHKKRKWYVSIPYRYLGRDRAPLSFRTILTFEDTYSRMWILDSNTGRLKLRRHNPISSALHALRKKRLKRRNGDLAQALRSRDKE